MPTKMKILFGAIFGLTVIAMIWFISMTIELSEYVEEHGLKSVLTELWEGEKNE